MADLLMLKFVLAGMTRNRKNAEEVLAAVHCLLSSNLITFPTSAASPIPTTDPDTMATLEEDEEHVRSNRFTGVDYIHGIFLSFYVGSLSEANPCRKEKGICLCNRRRL